MRATHQGTVDLGGIEINALHTPTFRESLLSIGQLDDAGYTSTFRQGISTIGAPGAGTITGHKRGSIYVIGSFSRSECPPAVYNSEAAAAAQNSANDNPEAVARKSANEKKRRRQRRSTLQPASESSTMPASDATMWHRRLAQLHSAALRTLVNGIRVTHDKGQCDVCAQAKHKQKFIRTMVQRVTKPFELVHSDTLDRGIPAT